MPRFLQLLCSEHAKDKSGLTLGEANKEAWNEASRKKGSYLGFVLGSGLDRSGGQICVNQAENRPIAAPKWQMETKAQVISPAKPLAGAEQLERFWGVKLGAEHVVLLHR